VGSVLTGESVPMKALRQQIRLMAPTNGRVLIYGESGTGKELIAHSIHAESLRRDQIFVELNCAAIPEAHIEADSSVTGTELNPAACPSSAAPSSAPTAERSFSTKSAT